MSAIRAESGVKDDAGNCVEELRANVLIMKLRTRLVQPTTLQRKSSFTQISTNRKSIEVVHALEKVGSTCTLVVSEDVWSFRITGESVHGPTVLTFANINVVRYRSFINHLIGY